MDKDTLWHHIDTERDAVATVLEGLDSEQWATPSLCESWTVGHVAAHLAWQDVRPHQAVLPLIRARFDRNAMIHQTAVRSPLTQHQIVTKLRSFNGRRVRPPFVSDIEPLIDVLVHTQDICLPLGLEHAPPADAVITAISRIAELNEGRMRLGPSLTGIHLVATDTEWQIGNGQHTVRGPLKHLLLAVAGRRHAQRYLSGDLESWT